MSSIDTSSQMQKCNEISSSSKIEVHKGKSHACRSIKSTNTVSLKKTSLMTPKLKVNAGGKSVRKNSLSSETISDSSSENSLSCKNALNQLKRTKSVNCQPVKLAEIKRKLSDATSVKIPDRTQVKASFGGLFSESDKEKTTENSNKLIRTSSFRLKNTPPIDLARTKAERAATQPAKCQSKITFRNKSPVVAWNSLWESSLAAKIGGGVLKEINQSDLSSKQVKYFMNWAGKHLKVVTTVRLAKDNHHFILSWNID